MDFRQEQSHVAQVAPVERTTIWPKQAKRLLVALSLALIIVLAAAGQASPHPRDSSDSSDGGSTPQCSDLIDNDGDGQVDLGDPDCASSSGDSELVDSSADNGGTDEDGDDSSSGSSDPASEDSASTTTTTGSGASQGSGSTTNARKKAKAKGLFDKQNGKGDGAKQTAKDERQKIEQPTLRNPDGSPAATNPGLTDAQYGPAQIGVSNAVIDSFEIPTFLLSIYQSCGTEYDIPWQVLAAINKIETNFGRNLNVSSAGAEGWMQFIPSTWKAYGVDANDDGKRDPYNPADAICSAARYLKAAGGEKDIRQAIYAYNHADWYVDEVLLYANQYGKLPDALVGSLTGLTEGAHFPVAADARYADDVNDGTALARSTRQRKAAGNAADAIESNSKRRSINIYSRVNAPVVAVNDSVIKKTGDSKELGKFIVLQDAYGNRYTYAQLGSIEKSHPLKKGSKVTGGTVIGRVGKTDSQPSHLNFAIKPAGWGATTIDPKPILDGWKLLETTAIYRSEDKNPFDDNASVSQVLLMSKSALEQKVLSDPDLSVYGCGRQDIQTGQIDRRVLAVLEYLVAKGYRLTITSLKCGHSYTTSSGNVSAHSYGAAVDISAVNGIPITGHQGPGSITEAVIKDLLALQGTMRPAQIISLMDLGGPSFAMSDHNDHIHVGYSFTTSGSSSKQQGQALKAEQWQRLIRRLGEIENPKVSAKPSAAAQPAKGAGGE